MLRKKYLCGINLILALSAIFVSSLVVSASEDSSGYSFSAYVNELRLYIPSTWSYSEETSGDLYQRIYETDDDAELMILYEEMPVAGELSENYSNTDYLVDALIEDFVHYTEQFRVHSKISGYPATVVSCSYDEGNNALLCDLAVVETYQGMYVIVKEVPFTYYLTGTGETWEFLSESEFINSDIVSFDDSEIVAFVQEKLNVAGYDCGNADGSVGDATRSAIELYGSENGIGSGNEIDGDLLNHLSYNTESKE